MIFDASSKTFRNDLYPEYKANRSEPPEELRPQFALVRDATRAFNLPCIEREGFEADDLIATYAKEATAKGFETVIVSSDKDLMQLVNDSVTMLDPMKDKRIGAGEVVEKFGVAPDKVVDVQSLMGDSTDNVPGVPGIGQKTAAQLIGDYGDLDTLLARASEIKQAKRRENLIEFADLARLSRTLVVLKDDVPTDRAVEEFRLEPPGAGNPARLPARTGVPHADPPGRGRVRRGRADRGAAGRGGRSGAGPGSDGLRAGAGRGAARRVDRARARARHGRLRYRNHLTERDARRTGRLLAGGRAGARLLCAARPYCAGIGRRRSAGPRAGASAKADSVRACAGDAQGVAGRPGDPQDRPQYQIRCGRHGRPRHRDRAGRRYHAAQLRLRRWPAQARHGRAGLAPFRAQQHQIQRCLRQGQSRRSASPRWTLRRRPTMPPRMPISPCGCTGS